MIGLDSLLKTCLEKGIKLSAQGENLKVNAAPGSMTAELAGALKAHKSELLKRLNQQLEIQNSTLSVSGLTKHAPLSFAQNRFWMLHSIAPLSSAYHIPGSFVLSGNVQVDNLLESFRSVINQHQILKTVYTEQQGVLTQSIKLDEPFLIDVIDLGNLTNQATLHEAIEAHKAQVFQSPFDLATDFPLRIRIVKCPNNSVQVILCVHHIAADAWSIPLFLKEIEEEYARICVGKKRIQLTQPQYIDFAIWQNKIKAEGVYENQFAYWASQLKDIPKVHEIKTDFLRPNKALGRLNSLNIQIPLEKLHALTALASTHKTTLFSLFHSLFALFIFRWSGQKHVVVGSPVSGRHMKDIEVMLGCFINSVVINNKVNEGDTFVELIDCVSKTVNLAMQNQELPFEHLVEALPVDRQLGANPIFQIMLAFQQGGESQNKFYDLDLQSSVATHSEAKVDLTLNVSTGSQGINVSWQYATALFSEETINSMAETFNVLLNQVLMNSGKPISDYHLVESQTSKIASSILNKTPKLLPKQYFAFLESNLEKEALSDEQTVWTSKQTLDFISKVQTFCLNNSIGPNDRVMLATDKSVQTYATVYALWGMGVAYIPVSSAIPRERIEQMVAQTNPRAIILDTSSAIQLPNGISLKVDISDIEQLPVKQSVIANTLASNTAYILFTSGTTGQPKGVSVSHQELAFFIDSLKSELPALPSKLGIDSPLIFDASLASIGLISQGIRLFAVPENKKTDLDALAHLLNTNNVDLLLLSTSFLNVLMSNDAFCAETSLSFKFGGEPCSQILWDKTASYCKTKGTYAVNAYGPTETTVTISCATVVPGEAHIGQPLSQNEFIVLDPFQHACPKNMVGELTIRGAQVSQGYVDTNLKDNDRFTQCVDGIRSFKTGDFVTESQSGNFKFVARRDNQIKLSGYRIELKDVEAIASYANEITQICAKVITKNEQAFLALFFVGNITVEVVKALCRKYLPSYMQPHVFEQRSALPMTANGKIDRANLEVIVQAQEFNESAIDGGLISEIATIWQSYLPDCRLNSESNFFSSGGHSIVAIKVVHEINEHYEINMPVSSLFECSILSEFTNEVDKLVQIKPEDSLLKELESLDESTLNALLEEL